MFKPKKYVRLDQLFALPTVNDCKRLFAEANKTRGSTVELPWRSQNTYIGYSLTVKIELGGAEPIWTLYEGEGNRARVVWSSPFEDIELMYDVLCLSLPGEEQGNTVIGGQPAAEPVMPSAFMPDPGYGLPFVNGPPMEATAPIPKPDDGYELFPSSPTEPLLSQPTITPVISTKREAPPAAPTPPPPPQPTQAQPSPYGYPPQAPPGYAYPQGYPQPQGYQQYPPGYNYPPPPPGYQYPPGYYPPAYPQPVAQTVPMQPGAAPVPSAPPDALPPATYDPDLMRKRPNIMLGSFLTEAGLIPESTLQAALRLQDMVKGGSLNTGQAAEAVRRAHERGGAIEQHYFSPSTVVERDVRFNAPPLGQILVEAGLIASATLRAALNLQDVVRTGAMSREDALGAFVKEHYGVDESSASKEERDSEQAIELLKQSGVLIDKDLDAARAVRKRHGGNIAKILLAAGKMDAKTFQAAGRCKDMMRQDKMKMEQSIILLNYCHRMRMTFDEAIEDMNWQLS